MLGTDPDNPFILIADKCPRPLRKLKDNNAGLISSPNRDVHEADSDKNDDDDRWSVSRQQTMGSKCVTMPVKTYSSFYVLSVDRKNGYVTDYYSNYLFTLGKYYHPNGFEG